MKCINLTLNPNLRLNFKNKPRVRSSAEEGFYFEPLLTLLTHFTKFMEAYQAAEDKDEEK